MTFTWKKKSLIALSLAASFLGFYILFFLKKENTGPLLNFSSAPNAYLRNSELISHQKNGTIESKITTPETEFKESEDQTFFKQPTLFFRQTDSDWNVKSDTAYTDNDYEKIDLYGNVKAISTPQNKDETITIRSYEAHHKNKIDYSEFLGNVRVEHRVHHVLCEKLTLNDAGLKQKMIAYGTAEKRAFYRATPEDKEPLTGLAKTIFYYPKQKKIIFQGNVYLTQKNRIFTGERIIYDAEKEIVTVPENRNTESVLILNPENRS